MKNSRRISSKSSFTLVEVMIAFAIGAALIGAGMIAFILLYRTSNDASKQIRVQRKADLLIERLSRGPFGGFGGIRGAYLNTQLSGNTLPNPVCDATTNDFHTLRYYAQTNFALWVHLATPVMDDAGFRTAHYPGNAQRYTIGYDAMKRHVYYQLEGADPEPIVELEDLDLAYLRFSGGLFQTNLVSTNAVNLITVEFGMPYLTSDGARRITNCYSSKVYIRNNF